jgi:cell wall-associated NlpC family hydrolase
MRRLLTVTLATALLFGPAWALIALAAFVNPAARASCLPANGAVADVAVDRLVSFTATGDPVPLDRTQLTRAATIINVGGATDGVGRDGIVIALMAALTESKLRMLSNATAYPHSTLLPNDGDGGDNDSLGLFQMRPTSGWGSVEDLMDAEYQARAFFGGATGPNRGSPRGLLDIPGWRALGKGAAAQAVEASAYPDRYAAFEPVAEAILRATAGPAGSTGSCGDQSELGLLPSGFGSALLKAAETQVGRPYVWGGGTYTGPSGTGSDGRGPGFDCSGLVLYAAYQASGGSIRLPHYSGAQITYGAAVPWTDRRPGDLIFFTYPGSSAPHHVALLAGRDRILQAPRTGQDVRFGTTSEFARQVMTVRRLTRP